MPNDLLQQNIAPLLNTAMLPEAEQALFLMDLGDLIMESALLRLVAELTEDQEASLSHYLETEPAPEILLEYLLAHHKNFESILEEEIIAFKKEAQSIFSEEHTTTVSK